MHKEFIQVRQLFQPERVKFKNRIYDLFKIMGLSDEKQSIGLGVFKSNDVMMICGYDPSTNQFGKLDKDKLAFASTVLNLLKDPLGPHLHNRLIAINPITDLMETDKSTIDVLVGDNSFDVGEPFTLISLVDGKVPFNCAAVEASSQQEIGKLLIANSRTGLYSGHSLRDYYSLRWAPVKPHDFKLDGSFYQGKKTDTGFIVTLESPIDVILAGKTIGNFETKGVHPFELAKYLLTVEDCGVNAIEIEGEESSSVEYFYYILTRIKGLSVSSNCSIGDITFASSLSEAPTVPNGFTLNQDYPVCAWTYQTAQGFADAQLEALRRIEYAVYLYIVCGCSERFPDKEAKMKSWDIRQPLLEPKLSAMVYVENLDLGGSILIDGNGKTNKSPISVTGFISSATNSSTQMLLSPLRASWKPHYLNEAMKWVVRARFEPSVDDRIISLNTALEYCLNEERGEMVLAEALHEMNYDRTDDLDFSQMLNDIVKSIDLPAIQGLNEKQRKILIRRIKSQAKASLLSSRLASRLTAMCKRLGDPITKQELQLLIDVNKARNGLLHGRRSVFLNTLDLDRAIVAASTLIVSKVEKFEESKL